MTMSLAERATATLALGFLLTVVPPGAAYAQACTKTWTAPVSDLWSNAARWTPAGVPTDDDDVCITVDGTYTVTLQGGRVARSLTVGNAQNTQVQTLLLLAFASNGNATLTVGNGVANAGAIVFDGPASGAATTLTVSNGVLANTSTGLLHTTAAGTGGRTLNADITNDGSVRLERTTNLSKLDGVMTNRSAFTVAAGAQFTCTSRCVFNQEQGSIAGPGTITMSADTFNFNGGSINGEVLLTLGSALNIGAGSVGAASFAFQNSGNTMSGDLAPGQTVLLRGLGPNALAVVTAANGFTNGGTIILDAMGTDASSSNTGAALTVTNGTLTNSATGLIHSRVSVAGASSRTFTGNLTNFGTVTVDQNTSLNKVGASYANSNTFVIKAGATLTVSGAGTTFVQQSPGAIGGGGILTLAVGTIFKGVGNIGANVSNSGQFHPGASPGVLNIAGNYTQTANGSFHVELGGSVPGQFDQLNISGQATLAGTLAVSVINNFCPSGTFTIATYASRSGDFGTKTGLVLADGRVMTATAGATAYSLSAPGGCASSTSLASAPNPSVFGQPVVFTATVTSGGNPVTVGMVNFKEGMALLGGSTLNAAGQASFSTTSLSAGSHTITAEYGGTADFKPSSGNVVQVVNKANTATSAVSSANPSTFGQPVTFTATVAAVAPGAGTPSGTVSFKEGAAALGTVTLSAGVASFTTSTLAVGAHSISVEYSGDGSFNPSAFVLVQTVNAAAKPAVAVTNENDDTVSFIDVETNAVAHTVAVGHKPVAATFFDAAFGAFQLPAKLYVAERRSDDPEGESRGGNGAIQVLAGPVSPTESNRAEFSAGAAIAVGSHPEALALSPDGSRLWVANRNDDSISIVERASESVIATLALAVVEPSKGKGNDKIREIGAKPMGVTFSPDGKYAYVTGRNSGNLVVVDAANPAILGHVDVGNKPQALAVSRDGTKVYAANRNGNEVAVVDVTDPARPALVARIATGDKPEGLALLNDGTKLYVTSRTTNSVTVFDVHPAAPYASVRTTVPVGSGPWGVAVTKPDSSTGGGEFIYVTNRDDNTVSVIDAATDAVIATVPVGKAPTGVAAGLLPTAP